MNGPATAAFENSMPSFTPVVWNALGNPVSDGSSTWWESLTGQSSEDTRDWRWLAVVHPEDQLEVRAAWHRAITHGSFYSCVYRILAADKTWHWLAAHGTPQRAEDGSVLGWTGGSFKVTGPYPAHQQSAQFTLLEPAAGAPAPVVRLCELLVEIVISAVSADAAAIVLRSSEEEQFEITAAAGLSQSSLQQLTVQVKTFQYPSAGPMATQLPTWIAHCDGRIDQGFDTGQAFSVDGYRGAVMAPITNSGTVAGAILLFFRDSEQVSAEQQSVISGLGMHASEVLNIIRLQEAERFARDQSTLDQDRLRFVADALPPLISYIDRDLRYQFTNDAYRRWFERDLNIVPGTPVVDIVGEATVQTLTPYFQRVLQGELTVFEDEVVYSGVGRRVVSATYVPDYDPVGAVRGFAVLAFDTTEQKHAETRAARLQDFTIALSQALTLEDVVESIVTLAAPAIDAVKTAVVVNRINHVVVWIGSAADPLQPSTEIVLPEGSITRKVMREREPIVVSVSAGELSASPVIRDLQGGDPTGQYLVLPLILQKRGIGCLVFAVPVDQRREDIDLGFASLLSSLSAGAIDRARLHDALEEREARFHDLAEALPQIVWVSSGDGRTLEYLNRRWIDYTGLPASQTDPGQISELVHHEDRLREQELWGEALAGGTLFEAEVRLRRHDGVYRWFLSRGVPVRDQRGHVVSWFGTMTDIDEQQRSIIHQRFVSLLDTRIRSMNDPRQIMQTLVATTGEHLPVHRCLLTEAVLSPDFDRCPATADDDGMPDCKIALRACWEASDTAQCANLLSLWTRVEAHFGEALRSGQYVIVDNVASDAGIQEFRAELLSIGVGSFAMVPFLRAGRCVATLSVHRPNARSSATDEMTLLDAAIKRTWPVVERSRAVDALRQSENRLRHAAEAADFGSFDFESATGRGYWDSDVMRVLRRPAGTPAPEQLIDFLGLIHTDDLRRVEAMIQETSNPDGDGDLQVEFRHMTGSGEMCWALLRGTVEFSGMGDDRQPARTSGIVMDITKRKQDEEERVAFIDAAAHDLKNPVAAIRALAQVAQRLKSRGRLEPERLAELLGSIEGATVQMTNVIQDLLDAANMRAGIPLVLRLERVDLVPLLAERVAVSHAVSSTYEFRYLPETSSISGYWDIARLQRVFDNLLSNAVKFSPAHSTIEIRVSQQNDWAVATILDTGIGIAAFDLARVFDWFQRGGNVPEQVSGTGIGLAGARQIVEQLGGTISVESEAGRGSTFTVSLPMGTPDPLSSSQP